MTVTVEKPKIITLLYRQEKSDPDYGSCLWARFYLDTQNYTMSIESDCGNYSYGWCPTPDRESFLHLLCRMDCGYLLGKLAARTIVDGDATWDALKGMIECECEELEDEVWQDLEAACYHQRNADDVCASVSDALRYTPLENVIEAYSIYECVEMDYHANAKKIVSVFLSAIVPVLRELEATDNA
jgi:hypothetical protein